MFTLVVGNPPFGDSVEAGDTDHLGSNALDSFELATGRTQVNSEFLIIERSLRFLKPGGRFGMVVPDGLLNNPGELSLCPGFRRFLFKNTKLLAVVSLPDHAFRKAGAQNKTSLLFFRKFTDDEQQAFDRLFEAKKGSLTEKHRDWPEVRIEEEALSDVYTERDYYFFIAEADQIGYNPAGNEIEQNDLYSLRGGLPDPSDKKIILGQYVRFLEDPAHYGPVRRPQCMALTLSGVLKAHPTYRLDPKFHLFKHEKLPAPPHGTKQWRVGDLLHRREERIEPSLQPDVKFKVLTLTQEGQLEDREPGKGNNPPDWYGEYFTEGSRWYVTHAGDLVFSQIDLWKGCVAIVPPHYDGAIFTQEFPIYQVDTKHLDPYYLKLLLRSTYFQRAIRAVTTGHSNRRRTQESDFENLEIFLPDVEVQQQIGVAVRRMEHKLGETHDRFRGVMHSFDKTTVGDLTPGQLIELVEPLVRPAEGS